jgi:hypothetical protein
MHPVYAFHDFCILLHLCRPVPVFLRLLCVLSTRSSYCFSPVQICCPCPSSITAIVALSLLLPRSSAYHHHLSLSRISFLVYILFFFRFVSFQNKSPSREDREVADEPPYVAIRYITIHYDSLPMRACVHTLSLVTPGVLPLLIYLHRLVEWSLAPPYPHHYSALILAYYPPL